MITSIKLKIADYALKVNKHQLYVFVKKSVVTQVA